MAHPLTELPLHQTAAVVSVGGARAFRRRLMEMGLTPGVQITITNVAPLGDPLELSVRQGRLSIRRHEASEVLVQAP